MLPTNIRFISFEGIDFCGKTTQIQLLVQKLQARQIPVEVVREPGGTDISEKIRTILLDKSHGHMVAQTEILLYSAARSQLVFQKIVPLLEKGIYVIADRYFDSTTAYQGYGRGLDIDFVKKLNRFATGGLLPFKTFFIDISPQEAEKRRQQAGLHQDRLEIGGIPFYQKVREGFLHIAAEEPERFVTISGERPIADIANEIWQHIEQIWNLNP